jgi:predicted N-acetyltransferase YhbS
MSRRDVEVRPAVVGDLPDLVAALGQERFFVDRLTRQAAGRGVLLVARIGGRVVGDVYLWLEPAEEEQVREHLPEVPLLGHLEVRAELRGRGIGTAVMAAAEKELVRLGYRAVALGVDMTNDGAERLYVRLGYTHWAHGPADTEHEEYLPDGGTRRVPEKCYIMVKRLAGQR